MTDVLTPGSTRLARPSISIISNISGPENTVQQPQSHPIWSVFAGGGACVKKLPRDRTWLRLLPGVDDCLPPPLLPNMMPEERCLGLWIIAFLVDEVLPVRVDFIVYDNGFFLLLVSIWRPKMKQGRRFGRTNILAWPCSVLRGADR